MARGKIYGLVLRKGNLSFIGDISDIDWVYKGKFFETLHHKVFKNVGKIDSCSNFLFDLASFWPEVAGLSSDWKHLYF
jgi:hypothetical protein